MQDAELNFWNGWNLTHRGTDQGDESRRQAEVVIDWLGDDCRLRILDAGCGTGWMSEALLAYGSVVGTDLADAVVARAAERVPDAVFVAGDVMTVDLPGPFDVVVSLEVLSHVEDQRAFMVRLRSLLVEGGRLILATQNRTVLERFNRIDPPQPGQRRRWRSRGELAPLMLDAGFRIDVMRTVSPKADHGPMRYVAKLGRLLHLTRLLERLGFGWTIMALATRN